MLTQLNIYIALWVCESFIFYFQSYMSQNSFEIETLDLVSSLCTEGEFISWRTKITCPGSLNNSQELGI